MPVNPHDQEKVDAIERDRQRRERSLLIVLLLLMDEAENDAYVMLKHGQSAQVAVNNVLQNAPDAIATASAEAYRDGVRRLALLTDQDVPRSTGLAAWKDANAGTVAELVAVFRPAAQQAVDEMASSINESIVEYVPGVWHGMDDLQLKTAVADAFDAARYSATNPMSLRLGVERAIVAAHNNGLFNGAQQTLVVTGLRHVSVLDSKTTAICRSRDGITLPIDDPFWLDRSIPPLHYNCRSTVLPVIGDFTPTEPREVYPAAPGFGEMSAVFLDRLRGGLAA